MPRKRAVLEPLSPLTAGLGQVALSEAWRHELESFNYAAIDAASRDLYRATYNEYKSWAAAGGYKGPVTAVSLGMYLKAKCKANSSAASFAIWSTHVVKCASVDKALAIEYEDKGMLRLLKRACGKTYGLHYSQAEEWGEDELLVIIDKLAPSPSADLRDFSVFTQAVVSHATLARPGDTCSKPEDVTTVRLKDMTFIPVSPKLPYGGISLALNNSKKMKLTGLKKAELLMAPGTGTAICPVSTLRRYILAHRLRMDSEEPLFAKLTIRGTRSSPPAPISNGQYNSGLARIFKKAGLPRLTARGSRPGRRTELGAAGALDSVVTTLGRWSEYQNGRPYARQRISLIQHIASALGVQPSAQPRGAVEAPARKRARLG